MSDVNLQTDLELTAEIKLYYDVFIPAPTIPSAEAAATPPLAGGELNPATLPLAGGELKRPLLIAVHGYGAHKRYMMREARLVAPENFVIASVQGPHQHFRPTDDGYRIGFGWLSDHKPEEYVALHHNFLLRLIDKLENDGLIDRKQIYLYGFSQACALNFRFAFTHPDVPAGVIGVCGGIPGDLDTNPIYKPFDARTLYLYGDDDEFYTRKKFAGFDKKLRETLPNFESKQFKAKHEITDGMRKEIRAFLADF